ncbi:PucR family transcriptional regulator [Kroppenstedtia pulmonis]|uniref:PucR family transcriptional regulator n=1 Tax=Kroppenstedtia pulmonis TaxID=1380685 RepID=A0A7D4BHN4_9BACL|nr:PucR family transcriptional regulator [Kroppenstedtia pulmonis]QKG84735.1 PucR family transcriptional regulator [Kroppenstedtia pulmonis]
MPLSVAEVLTIQAPVQCRLVAGRRGLHRCIRSVSIMDSPDTSLWLKPGDLLITTGYVFKDDANLQVRLIRDLAEGNCAGLAIKIKRFFLAIPEAMRLEADRLSLPLFEIPYDLGLSDVLCTLTREIINRRQLVDETQRTNFFAGLLEGEFTDKGEVLNRGWNYGLLPECEYIVLCVMLSSDSEKESIAADRVIFQGLVNEVESLINVNLLGVQLDDGIVIIQRREENVLPSTLARKVAELFIKRYPKRTQKQKITVGIGSHQPDVLTLYKSYQEAKEAIYLGRRASSRTGDTIYEFSAYEPEALLQHLPDDVLSRYVTATLEVLKQYDQENGTELLHTLEIYLNCGRRLREAADKLYVHRNTVKFRINRIEELLGIDLSEGEAAFRLQLALRVAHLLGFP